MLEAVTRNNHRPSVDIQAHFGKWKEKAIQLAKDTWKEEGEASVSASYNPHPAIGLHTSSLKTVRKQQNEMFSVIANNPIANLAVVDSSDRQATSTAAIARISQVSSECGLHEEPLATRGELNQATLSENNLIFRGVLQERESFVGLNPTVGAVDYHKVYEVAIVNQKLDLQLMTKKPSILSSLHVGDTQIQSCPAGLSLENKMLIITGVYLLVMGSACYALKKMYELHLRKNATSHIPEEQKADHVPVVKESQHQVAAGG